MEYPVMDQGTQVGFCQLTDRGLYWGVQCTAEASSEELQRLYCGSRSLGLFRPGRPLTLERVLSKSAWPELPPQSGCFSLSPQEQHWRGVVDGVPLEGIRAGDKLLLPYDPAKPCPCEPLFCFFEIRDGYWQLPMKKLESVI